jgi:aminoglycoside 3-N-acetyltransferase
VGGGREARTSTKGCFHPVVVTRTTARLATQTSPQNSQRGASSSMTCPASGSEKAAIIIATTHKSARARMQTFFTEPEHSRVAYHQKMAVQLASIRESLSALRITTGHVVMVHASLRSIGPVVGGAAALIQAILDAIGPSGTLVAYVDWEPFFEDSDVEVPVFNKRTASAARDHGVLHEVLRTWPGALRSDHPDAGIAAIGAEAGDLTEEHPFQYGYGPGTPFEKLSTRAKVLMLGAPLDTITLLHYAEHMARLPAKRIHRYRRLMPTHNGSEWMEFEEFDTAEPVHPKLPPNCFELIARDFIASGGGVQAPLGDATCHVFEGRELVPFAIAWLERQELTSKLGFDVDEQHFRIPRIDERSLLELVREYETAQGFDCPGAYSGLYTEELHEEVANCGESQTLLGCDCGTRECWPLTCRITRTSDWVVWDEFKQPFRPERDYSGLGPFAFDAREYDEAIQDLSIVRNTSCGTSSPVPSR